MFGLLCSFFHKIRVKNHPCHDGFHLPEDSTGPRQVFQKAGTFGAPGEDSRRAKICQVKGEMIYIYIFLWFTTQQGLASLGFV